MKSWFVAIFLTSIIAVFPAAAQEPDTASEVKRLVAAGDNNAAIFQLLKLRTENAKLFTDNNYDYLLARMYQRSGNNAAALKEFQVNADRRSILREYSLWHMAEIFRESGNLTLERLHLTELSTFFPDSLLAEAAKNRIARSFYDSGNYKDAISALTVLTPIKTIPGKALTAQPAATDTVLRQNLLLLANSLLQTGDKAAAREKFLLLVDNLKNPAQPDDFALDAVKGLDLLDGGPALVGRSAPSLNDVEHFRRAGIYQFNRDFPDARLHYQSIIVSHPTSGYVPDAIYQTGRGYTQEGNFAEAVKSFERLIEQHSDNPIAKDALLQSASAYKRMGKHPESLRRYQRFIDLYPDDEKVERAYLNIIDVQRDLNEDLEALRWCDRTIEQFKGKLPEAVAAFSAVRIRSSRNEWNEALAAVEKLEKIADLGGTKIAGGTNATEVKFIKAVILEKKQSYLDAINTYLTIADGRGEYYGWRATERLRALAQNEVAKPLIDGKILNANVGLASNDPNEKRRSGATLLRLSTVEATREKALAAIKESYENLPDYDALPGYKTVDLGRKLPRTKPAMENAAKRHKEIADELIFLGLYDEGTPEIDISLTERTRDIDYTLALFYLRGDMADRAVGFAESVWRTMPADYQNEVIPRAYSEMLYPAPFKASLLEHAAPRHVDPRFLLSIMRQESRYRANVKSYAAARGSMQFISTTAQEIAAKLNLADFRQDDLYNADTAILFGSQYAADLFIDFPKQPQAVAASYNGGEDNMKRWLGRSRTQDPDLYVIEIAFSQSKDYVYKVMANYRMYQMLYDNQLNLK